MSDRPQDRPEPPSDPLLDRRQLLALGAAGSGLLLGLGWWGAAAQADEQPAGPPDPAAAKLAWREAIEAMRRTGRPGLVVVVPAEPAARRALGEQLARRIPLLQYAHGDDLPEAALLLLEAVWVCAPPDLAPARAGETLVLVGPDGERIAGAAVDLSSDEAFLEGARGLLHGEGRLEARAEAARTPEVAEALEAVAGSDPWQAFHTLREQLDRVVAAVIQVYLSTEDPEVRQRLRQLLREAYRERLHAERGFPYGVRWKVVVDEPEPCPPCGMARASLEGRTFLDFFTR